MNNNAFSKKIMYILKDIYKKLLPQLLNLPDNIIILELRDVNNYHGLTELDYFDWRSSSDKKYLISEITKPTHIKVRFYDNDNKRLPLETVKPAIEKAKRAGLLVHTFWIIGYPGETYDEIQQTIDFAMGCGADSFTFSVLTPLSGTPVYRQTLKENLWWDGKENQNTFRSSLVKVDGFSSAQEFENFVNQANIKANLLLKQRDPKRFDYKYRKRTGDSTALGEKDNSFVKQT